MPPITVASTTTIIKAPIEAVWAIISGYSSIKAWMPSIDSCTATGNHVGAVRMVNWGGNTTEERLEVLDHIRHEISYKIMDSPILPVRNSHGRVTLTSIEASETKISWVAEAEEFVREAGDEGKALVQAILGKFIETSIEGLQAALKPAKVQLF